MLKKSYVLLLLLLFSGFVFGQNLKKIISSEIRWKAYKTLKSESMSHYGTIGLRSGAVSFDNAGNLTAGKFFINMSDIDAEDMNGRPKAKLYLENHLRNEDFFDVKKYPTSTFAVTKVKKNGNSRYIITGKLTIKGITQNISFPVTITRKGDTYTLVSDQFTFNRKKFGLNYNVFEDMLISNDVEVNVRLVVK